MTRGPHRPDDAGAALESRLASALHSGLDEQPVDVGEVLHGARSGAGRIRRRRRAVAAVVTALAVVAVPLGLDELLGRASPARPAAQQPAPEPLTTPPSASATTATSAPPVAPPTALSPPVRPSLSPLPVPAQFPEDTALAAPDFDRPMRLLLDEGSYRNGPTVADQACSSTAATARSTPEGSSAAGAFALPDARRSWLWAERATNDLDQLQVELTLTGWRHRAAQALDDVAGDTGACRWLEPVQPVDAADLPGQGAWAASADPNGLPAGYAVLRVGDVLVAVSVHDPDGPDAAVSEAKRLAVLAAGRAEAALS